nr:hypothetical protein [Tanacetum cinerariifolium]
TLYCLFLNPLNLVLNPEPRTDFSAAATVPSDVSSSHSYVSTGQRRSTPPATGQRRRFTVVTGGQRWRSTTVAGGEPPLTAAGPPLTTTGPPVNGGWLAGQRPVLGRSGSGLGWVWIGSATCHATCQPHVHTCQPRVLTWQLTWILSNKWESNPNNDLLAQTKMLKEQLQVKHVVIDTHVECHKKYAKLKAERYEYMIRYSAYFDNDKQHRKQIADQQVLFDKISVQMVELDKHVRDLKNTVLEKVFKISELEECVRNKDLEIENFLERLNVCENKLHKMGQTNQTVHMIMPSKDNLYNGRKGIGFENPSYFEKAKDLRPTLYDEKVIGLGYTPMFLTHSDEALEIEKFKRSRENKIEFAYDYRILNASYVNEKVNFKDDYFQEIINPDFEKIDSPF